jgi:serine/threonine-protein kinase RsbW
VISLPSEILVIESELSELQRVESFLKDLFTEFELPAKYFNKVLLCVSEAVVNAIKHGNKSNVHKKVSISVWCNDREVQIQVEDEGEGFDIVKLEDPTKKENLRKESGRGIYIIKKLTDKLEYNKKGNKVKFKLICSEEH